MTSTYPALAAVVSGLRAAGCVFAEDEARLLASVARTPAELDAMVDRRAAGTPLEHVVGHAEFAGLRIAVEPGVFVPRRRSELLAAEATALAGAAAKPDDRGDAAAGPRPVVVDLCCGSGAVGAVVAATVTGIELHAADVDPVAVRCTRRNIPADAQVYGGDLFDALPAGLRGRVAVLVANVPYVPTDEVRLLPAEARMYEPRVALDGGTDGLDVLRRVTVAATRWLAPGGSLLVESSERQQPAVVAAFDTGGLTPRVVHSDDPDATVVIGTGPATST